MSVTRIPRPISSPYKVRASDNRPPWLAAYTLEFGMPMRELIDVMSTIGLSGSRRGGRLLAPSRGNGSLLRPAP